MLSVDQFPNACAVTFRVFIELSVDHYVETHKLMNEAERRNKPLSKRMRVAIDDLRRKGRITAALHKALERVADGSLVLASNLVTLNQYVHNPHTFPKPSELRTAWDELDPLLKVLWP